MVVDEVEKLKKKRLQVEKDIESLNQAADKNMEYAEAKGSPTFVSKANALR